MLCSVFILAQNGWLEILGIIVCIKKQLLELINHLLWFIMIDSQQMQRTLTIMHLLLETSCMHVEDTRASCHILLWKNPEKKYYCLHKNMK